MCRLDSPGYSSGLVTHKLPRHKVERRGEARKDEEKKARQGDTRGSGVGGKREDEIE